MQRAEALGVGMDEVSVIIPTFDRGALLLRSIASVIQESGDKVKVIVVDNGVAPAEIREKSDKVLLIRTKSRIGPSKARNIGAQHADSEYIAFLDDDDVWEPGYLQHSLELLKQGADVVVGQLKRQTNDGKRYHYKLFPCSSEQQRGIYYKNPGFGGQNIIIRRELFLRIGGFDESMPASVDRDLAARLLQTGANIMVQPKSVAVLCDHEGERVRGSQLRGNWMFIKKHWRHMHASELFLACKTLLKRFIKFKFLSRKIS